MLHAYITGRCISLRHVQLSILRCLVRCEDMAPYRSLGQALRCHAHLSNFVFAVPKTLTQLTSASFPRSSLLIIGAGEGSVEDQQHPKFLLNRSAWKHVSFESGQNLARQRNVPQNWLLLHVPIDDESVRTPSFLSSNQEEADTLLGLEVQVFTRRR